MKTKKDDQKIKKIVAIAAIVSFTIGLLILLLFLTNTWPFNHNQNSQNSNDTDSSQTTEVNLEEPTEEEIEAGKEIKSNNVINNDSSSGDNFSAIITNVTQDSDTLLIGTLLQTVSNNGTCRLKLSDGNYIFETTSGIEAMPTTSACKGFEIDIANTGLNIGLWSIKLSVTIGEKTASFETSKTIEAY